MILYGCGKPTKNPTPTLPTIVSCVLASDIDQSLGLRNFEYDDKGQLAKMTAPNGYYGAFVRTITSTKAFDEYPSSGVDGNGKHYDGSIKITYSYSGLSATIYDSNPEFLNEFFVQSNPPGSLKRDSLFQFKFDDAKKHLTTVLVPGNGYEDKDGFKNFRTELVFAYDGKENVIQAKIIYDYTKKTVVYPSGESRIDYIQKSDETINISYDDKPSPYLAISKYWKFIGEDFLGFGSYNGDKIRFWVDRCMILSKNNPIKITGKLRKASGQDVADIDETMTYQYNEKNYPINMAISGVNTNAFTYNCK